MLPGLTIFHVGGIRMVPFRLSCKRSLIHILFLSEYSLQESPGPNLQIFLEWCEDIVRLIHPKSYFSNGIISSYKNVYKNYREELLNVALAS